MSSRPRPDAAAPSGQSRRIREYLDDATDLGAEVIVSEAGDLADGIVQVARARRVTRLVMPHRTSSALERVRRSTLTERILERLPTLEVTVVADAREKSRTRIGSVAATDPPVGTAGYTKVRLGATPPPLIRSATQRAGPYP